MSEAHEDTSKPAADEPKLEAAETPNAGTHAAGDADKAEPVDAKVEGIKAEGAEAEASKAEDIKAEGTKDDGAAPAGTSLAPAAEAPTGIDPFLAKASEPPAPAPPRPFYAKALDYSAHAAMIVGLIGFAWTVSDHVATRNPASTATPVKAADATATPTATAKPVDELGDLRRTNQKMAAEIRNLHASLEALRTTVVRERSSGDDVRSLSAAVDQVKSGLAATRNEQTAQIGQLAGKLDKLQRETHQQVADRGPRSEARAPEPKAERREVDTTATASIPAPAAKAVPTPPAKPTVLAKAETESRPEQTRRDDQARDDDKPAVISGWVVRDVYQGVALIEGRRGSMEVVPGVSIPGAGVVKSIDRHGGGWTVTTTKGQLAFAAQQRETQREPRRGGYRDYYGPRGYDY